MKNELLIKLAGPVLIAIGILIASGMANRAIGLYEQSIRDGAIDNCQRNSLSKTVEDNGAGTVRTWEQTNTDLYEQCLQDKGYDL